MNHPLAASPPSNAGSTALGFIFLAFGIVAYWVPSIVAIARRKDIPNFAGVIIINFLLGWTFIGWIVALVMAVKSRPQPAVFAPGPYGFAPPPGPFGPSQPGPYGYGPPPQQPPQTFPYPPAQQPQQWQDPRQP